MIHICFPKRKDEIRKRDPKSASLLKLEELLVSLAQAI
jgi:hypothetical protein